MTRAGRGCALLTLLFLPALPAVPLSAQSASGAQPAQRSMVRIVVLYGHDPNAPGVAAFTAGLHRVLRSEWRPEQLEVYNELLDADRLGARESWPQIASNLAKKYRGVKVDAVVAEGSMAVLFAVERLGPIFPRVPIVYGNAFEPVVDFDALPANVTGRRIPVSLLETFDLARRLQPDATRVVLVAGASATDSAVAAAAIQELTPRLGSVQLQVLRDWSYPSLLQSLRVLPDRSFVILSSFRRDWQGQSFNSGDMIPSLTRASAVPVYGISRNWIGDGVVGGSTIDWTAEGEGTGRLLVTTLRRRPGERLPVREVARNPSVVDWRELRRWGLSEARLPPGTRILYRVPTAWERYRTAIFVVLTVTGAQTLLIALLVLERRKRIRAQRSIEEQIAYERMLAALRTDAIRHAPDDASHALEHAVARLGRYAGAHTAELLLHDDGGAPSARSVHWAEDGNGATARSSNGAGADTEMRIELLAEATPVGTLTLRGLPSDRAASAGWRERLDAAADVLGGALARARGERALSEAKRNVAHIARVATVGQLSTALSHELRQPLTAVRLHAETGLLILAQDPPDMPQITELFRDIVDDNSRAIDVLEHVRLLVRKESAAPAEVSMNDVARNAAKLLQRDADSRHVVVELSLAEGLPPVLGDAVQLQQVMINLVLNAVESAATSGGAHRVVVSTAFRAGEVEVDVSDSGPGLAPEVLSHLFESYVSTKKAGLGMGLAIVREIVEQHHGRVRGENMPSSGALFCVTLPAAPSATPAAAARA